jgi:predicted acyltransferase
MDAKPADARITSIDALRGFDMFWIMGGDTLFTSLFLLAGMPAMAAQLEHTAWNGFTFYDLIFPLFLFLAGVSVPIALEKRMARGEAKSVLGRHVLVRTAKLMFFGFLVNGLLNLDIAGMRWPGVLQRIAIGYCAASFAVLYLSRRSQAVLAAAIILGYWAILLVVPTPGVGAYVLTPEGNLAGYLDRLLVPGSFCCYPYGDNEGLLSTLPAIGTALLGVLASYYIRSAREPLAKTRGLAGYGLAAIVLALAWHTVFPINKLLWSSPYVLLTGGLSLLLLALFYWVIDVRGWRAWAFPFVVIGMNPITIYLVQALFDFGVVAAIFTHGFINHLGVWRTAFEAGTILVTKWLFLYFLYRQKIFLKA